MESFNIKSDLVNLKKQRTFGNMRIFYSGEYNFNKRGVGLYLTILIIIVANILASLIM